MMTGPHFLKKDGTIHSRGIDYGGKVTLIFRAGDLLVVRNKGSMCWASIGNQEYARSEWGLIRVALPVEVKTEGPPWYDVEPDNWNGVPFQIIDVIEQHEPGRQWREYRDVLIKKARKHAVTG
jgi:hypothetical protein